MTGQSECPANSQLAMDREVYVSSGKPSKTRYNAQGVYTQAILCDTDQDQYCSTCFDCDQKEHLERQSIYTPRIFEADKEETLKILARNVLFRIFKDSYTQTVKEEVTSYDKYIQEQYISKPSYTSIANIAAKFDVNARSVQRWVVKFREQGDEDVAVTKRTGRKPKLGKVHKQLLGGYFEYDADANLASAVDRLAEEFDGLNIAPSTVRKLIKDDMQTTI
ncbi:hypothetical protein CLU79DRAFT_850640 [Phycomyces nitens]|nr:hypothetical protein CLU79DRAFT_850640 [Phycomyces nitens]